MTVKPGGNGSADPDFPHAPTGWTRQAGGETAGAEGLQLEDAHWEAVRALQEFFDRHRDDPSINSRALHDALEEHFHAQGGMKYLYSLFPGGPVTQGCRLAGLEAPAGSSDTGFGSVQ